MKHPVILAGAAVLAGLALMSCLSSCRSVAGPYDGAQRPAHEVERGLDPVPQGSGRTETATGAGMLR